MQSIPNPDSWLDVFTILSVTLLVAVPSWLAARNHGTLKRVDRSISNGHSTPLREDVDDIRKTLSEIRSDLHSVKSELGDIRHQLREERNERRNLDERFERHRREQQ